MMISIAENALRSVCLIQNVFFSACVLLILQHKIEYYLHSTLFRNQLSRYPIIRFSQRASERIIAESLTRKLKSIADALR